MIKDLKENMNVRKDRDMKTTKETSGAKKYIRNNFTAGT